MKEKVEKNVWLISCFVRLKRGKGRLTNESRDEKGGNSVRFADNHHGCG